jgi:hypothetical protein
LVVGARSYPGNPFDGHTLSDQLEQATNLLHDTGVKPHTATVDLGLWGVEADNPGVQIIYRGKFNKLSTQQRKRLRRRSPVQPTIGHLKDDHAMRRCWLKGETGDALHAVLCAAGFNIRWLMRAILDKGILPLWQLFCACNLRCNRQSKASLRMSAAHLAPHCLEYCSMRCAPLALLTARGFFESQIRIFQHRRIR